MTKDCNLSSETNPECPIPPRMAHMFWDADPERLDLETHRRYVIERVLELGTEEDLCWLFGRYGTAEIRAVVCSSRRLSRQTASCWRNFFSLREEEMRCFGTFSMNPDGYF